MTNVKYYIDYRLRASRTYFFPNERYLKKCLMAFMTSTVSLALFQARFTVYRLCGWIDAACRVYGTPRFVALPAVHSHATPPMRVVTTLSLRPGPVRNIAGARNNFPETTLRRLMLNDSQ